MNELRQVSEAIESVLENALNCDCQYCDSKPIIPQAAAKIRAAWERRLLTHGEISREAVHALRILARADEPVLGFVFDRLLHINERRRKRLMRELRDEWLLPLCGTRQNPKGYYIATTLEQLLEWGRVTRSQAISELAGWYRVFRANAPDLAGQQSLDFVTQVSGELQEAIH